MPPAGFAAGGNNADDARGFCKTMHKDINRNINWIGTATAIAVDDMAQRSPAPPRVTRDMERIFGRVSSRGKTEKTRAPDAVMAIPCETGDRWPGWLIGTAIIALAVILIASVVAWTAQRMQPTPRTPADETMEVRIAPPGALRARAPEAARPARLLAASPVHATVRRQPVRAVANAACENLGRIDRSRCMRPRLLHADQRLRTAYARAARAGVDARTLASYNRRWTRLLGKAVSQPDHVTDSLASMATRLDQMRAML